MKITYSSQSTRQRHYVPPAMGNGKISLMLDKYGCMKQDEYCFMRPVIVLAGKRYEDRAAQLVRFGYFDDLLPDTGKLLSFQQTLDLEKACCECICVYESGLEVKTLLFCHAGRNIIAIHKEFSGQIPYSFLYEFPQGPFLTRSRGENDGIISYSSGTVSGKVQIYSPRLTIGKSENISKTLLEAPACSHADIFIAFDEEINDADSFAALFESHCAVWKKYWEKSMVSIPDEEVMKMYMTAKYHLKISSTPWSVPTGLFPLHWEGRFFAYDEFYTHGAFLSCGNFEEAAKIDHFRYSILEKAIRRACYVTICPPENRAAHFPWETREDGSEAAPDGFWMDRYIHMANIAFSAWEYWCFTGDGILLEKELYPLIRACAEYIRRCAVYEDSAKGFYIGKCTDMERFGEFIERPYSTTCGAVAVFRAAAKCAEKLGKDEVLREKWNILSEKLIESLPEEEEMYVPYKNCPQRSIAMYHGLFPYAVIPPENELQKRAIEDTEAHFQDFAGQYTKSGQLSAWYAGVIATAEVRRGNWKKALQLITEAAKECTGCFYECFEVYERKKLPWFTTASGALIRAVNELLQYAEKNNIPLWDGKSFSAKLPEKIITE